MVISVASLAGQGLQKPAMLLATFKSRANVGAILLFRAGTGTCT